MLKGKTALVTGSTSGIGLAMATAFAAEGCNIVLNGFGDAAAIEATRAGLARAHGVAVTYSPADMAKGDEIAAMMSDAAKQFGTVDILCNNAGISTWRRSTNSPSTSGTRSTRSTCRRRSIPSARCCRG